MYRLYMRFCDLIVIFIEPKVQAISCKLSPYRYHRQFYIGFLAFRVSNPIRAEPCDFDLL